VSAPTILIAEDHPMFRGALALMLHRLMPDAELIEVASQDELRQALARHAAVRLVLLDLRIPGANGFSALVFLRGEYPDVPVAIISGGPFRGTIDGARQLGGAAFISKAARVETFAKALWGVIGGEQWFDPPHAASDAAGTRLHDQLTTLTPQQ